MCTDNLILSFLSFFGILKYSFLISVFNSLILSFITESDGGVLLNVAKHKCKTFSNSSFGKSYIFLPSRFKILSHLLQ